VNNREPFAGRRSRSEGSEERGSSQRPPMAIQRHPPACPPLVSATRHGVTIFGDNPGAVASLLAARLWRAQALRIVNAGKSKYFEAAIDNLERARDCFRRAGRDAEWEQTSRDIGGAHSRKHAFMREFALVVKDKPVMRSSFLKVAMVKWQNRSAE
jgi:hypothetical protein